MRIVVEAGLVAGRGVEGGEACSFLCGNREKSPTTLDMKTK